MNDNLWAIIEQLAIIVNLAHSVEERVNQGDLEDAYDDASSLKTYAEWVCDATRDVLKCN